MIGIYAPLGKMGKALTSLLEEKRISYITNDRYHLEYFIEKSSVVIDFSTPNATKILIDWLIKNNKKIPLVIGTTGLSEEIFENIHHYSAQAPVFYAANFSLGVFVQKKLSEIAAKILDYDVEIFEMHHALKKDAPSGTALYLGKTIAEARKQNFDDVRTCYQKNEASQLRKKGQIGFSVARGGQAIGEHTVHFLGEFEELSISHKGYSRTLYASGAVLAAHFLLKKDQSGFFTMDDLIG
jgi:4-hydroxy-tetrahydrodipicolinate reductase